MVDISSESLKIVKSALSDFQTDISGFSGRSQNAVNDIICEGQAKLAEAKNDAANTEAEIKKRRTLFTVLTKKYHKPNTILPSWRTGQLSYTGRLIH